MKRIITLIPASMSLTGCNSEPPNTDISQAMQSFMSEIHGTLSSSKKPTCKDKESDSNYLCSVEFNAKLPIADHKKSILELKFIKPDGSWKTMVPLE